MLDPVRDRCADQAVISTKAADAIIDLVQTHGYTVDYILETHATGSQCLSAAWYLRMQFSDSQSRPPQLCDEATVAGLQTMWKRKYGADSKLSTSIRAGLGDGESLTFGALSLACIHLPGFATPHRRAYHVGGKDLFGAHSVATLTEDLPNDGPGDALESESERHLDAWTAARRIWSLPGDSRVWRHVEDGGAAEQVQTFDLLSQCAALSESSRLSKDDFERISAEAKSSRSEQRPSSSSSSHKAGSLRLRWESWIRG